MSADDDDAELRYEWLNEWDKMKARQALQLCIREFF